MLDARQVRFSKVTYFSCGALPNDREPIIRWPEFEFRTFNNRLFLGFGLFRFVSVLRTFTETTETCKPVSKQTETITKKIYTTNTSRKNAGSWTRPGAAQNPLKTVVYRCSTGYVDRHLQVQHESTRRGAAKARVDIDTSRCTTTYLVEKQVKVQLWLF